jgi:hypothetical protein
VDWSAMALVESARILAQLAPQAAEAGAFRRFNPTHHALLNFFPHRAI